MSRIRNMLALLRAQLWIIPLALSLLALALAYWVLTTGGSFLEGWTEGSKLWWLYGGDAESARGLLSSLLSGLMTMTSLIVSVTFVILTLSANQLGPRLISTFMADRQIQAVLGLFMGTIMYVLLVLRSLDETLGREGVPHIAVTIGSALTMVCLFALLFYVHKIARSIIADNVVERVAEDLHSNIAGMLRNTKEESAPREMAEAVSATIALDRAGYVQVVDYTRLVEIACSSKSIFRVNVRAGHFVLRKGAHVVVHGGHPVDDHMSDAIRAAFVIGVERSPAQDMEYNLRQLVEIALRALSPGINDPYTAIAVVNQLGATLEEIFRCSLPPVFLRDDAGELRVIAQRSDMQGLVDAAFDAIRQAGSDSPSVLIRIADVLGQLAPVLQNEAARQAVTSQLSKLAETVEQSPAPSCDRTAILSRIAQAADLISSQPKSGRIHVI
ncbi:DUF2254 domain-containing protein [Microvirga guangxiensis]|uniref:Uncharacterized membrane protein n=1 Tax=Microvirga guangxiensis TaxID=549386 RepID=A0A1G5HS63_9HYPH|nr:DUF2254 domain-containing protein [Microvirga guangxiensis]SCY66140.1 Uncharacterized membrane protein [Microvirga guangxiensis]